MTAMSDAAGGAVKSSAGRDHLAFLRLAFKLALRDLRGGLSGFYVFLGCVALGVAVIAGIGALSDALRSSLEREGQALLGGDIAVSRIHIRATDAERTWLAGRGRALSETATLRSMARPNCERCFSGSPIYSADASRKNC